MHTTKTIQNFNDTELKKLVPQQASWHEEFKDSAYLFIGGLNFDMNEGDIAIVFSQFGEIVDVRLMRDKGTGKSRGFAFLAYEDQRSTVLAVDNLNGAEICGRTIRVDHIKKFKPPKEFLEAKEDENGNEVETIYKPSGPDGRGWGQYRDYTEEERRIMQQEEEMVEEQTHHKEQIYDQMQARKQKIIIDEDERWEKKLMDEFEDETEAAKEQKLIKKKIKKEMKKRMKLERKLKGKDKKEKKEKKSKKEKAPKPLEEAE